MLSWQFKVFFAYRCLFNFKPLTTENTKNKTKLKIWNAMKLGYYVPSREMKKGTFSPKYVRSKIRFSSLAGPVPRFHVNDLPRKMLLRRECCSFLAFRTVKSPFRTSWTWKRVGILKSKLKSWTKCSWSEKKNQRNGKKCSWRENLYVISDFVPRSVRLIRKNVRFPTGDVRDRQRERHNRVYVLSRVRTNRVSLCYSNLRALLLMCSCNNDLQMTLWVTQRCFYSFQTFRRSTPSSVK